MIRSVDPRTNEYDQNPNQRQVLDSRDVYGDERYYRIENNVNYFGNIQPQRYRNDQFTEYPTQRYTDGEYRYIYQEQGSQINIERVNDNRNLQNDCEAYNQQEFHYRVPNERNVIERSEGSSSGRSTNQQSPEIYQSMAPIGLQRSTVLRHSSFIPREEILRSELEETIYAEIPIQQNETIKNTEDFIKVLKPHEINRNLPTTTSPRSYYVREASDLDRRDQNHLIGQEKYHLLKKQLLSRVPILKRIQNSQPKGASGKHTTEVINGDYEKQTGESIIFSERFSIDPIYHPYAITKELTESNYDYYNPEDLTLRYEVIVFLWSLLGEARLLRTGYPSASIHLVLWRVVHICCSVAGVKSAAAVPLPDNHNCGDDMLCFRDHVHRFLEVCAPTRDHWKQFGWASLTVDAVMKKVYKQELLKVILEHVVSIPTPIRMAMRKLAVLEKEENDRVKRQIISRINSKLSREQPTNKSDATMHFRPILPKPPEKRKRGRPIKIKKNLPDAAGRIQRVMLWRFIMNLLEEPGNEDCIHWVRREEGIFRILNTDWLARIWGRRHGNPRMTYEKMARAMRTYYRSKVLQPVPRARNLPRKLVYKFNPALVKKIPLNRTTLHRENTIFNSKNNEELI